MFMKNIFLEKLANFNAKLETISISLALIGLLLFFVKIENYQYFLIIGCFFITLLYSLRFITAYRISRFNTVLDFFIDQYVHGILIISIVGSILNLLGLDGVLSYLSITLIIIIIITQIYNNRKNSGSHKWSTKYYLRIVFIIGLNLILILKDNL